MYRGRARKLRKNDFKNKKNDRRNDKKRDFKDKPFKRDFEEKTFLQEDAYRLEGRNPILEALNTGRTIDKIFVKKGENEGTIRVIVAKALERGIIVQEVDKQKLEQMSFTHNCQGVIAFCPAYEYCELSDILDVAKKKNEPPFIIILDEITDPHNLGAVIRTANAAGAHGVVIPKHRAAGLTTIVGKTSAGAVEYVPVAKVTNIAKAIDDLKKAGVWVACADMEGQEYFESDLKGAIAVVIGNEGKGVGRLIKEKCDFSVSIPMKGQIASLNASVAASLIMYEIVRQRKG